MPTLRPRFQRLALAALAVLGVALATERLVEAAPLTRFSEALAVSHADELYRQAFDVRPGGDLVVDLGAEAVVVETTSGSRALVTVEGRGRDAEREFERRRFTARASGGDLDIRTDPPQRSFNLFGLFGSGRSDAQFTVTVRVPDRYNVSVDVGSGAVRVGPRLQGNLMVDTGSGAVVVGDVTGRQIVIDTGSGAVRAGRLAGDVTIDTGSGAVAVRSVEGRTLVDTGSGAVSIGSVEGATMVDTGSGGVALTLASAAPVEVDTGSGGVALTLPRGTGFDVDLDGGSVQIDEALDFRGRRERDEAQGTLGRGGPLVEVDTGSGSIRLRAQ